MTQLIPDVMVVLWITLSNILKVPDIVLNHLINIPLLMDLAKSHHVPNLLIKSQDIPMFPPVLILPLPPL